MQTYNLARLAQPKTRRPSVTLPPISDSKGAQTEYLRALRAMLREMAATVKADILPQAEAEIARQRAAMTTDAWGANVFEELKALAVQLGVIAEGMVGRILRLESERHTKKWLSSVRSAIGIDIGAVVSQEDLSEYLTTAAARNAALIRSLREDVAQQSRCRAMLHSMSHGAAARRRKPL